MPRSGSGAQGAHKVWELLSKTDGLLGPIPFLEQIGNGVTEPRQEVFTLQKAAGTDQLALGWRVADFDAFVVRIDGPGDLVSAGKEIFEPFINLAADIIRGEYFHR